MKTITHKFVQNAPDKLEEGVLYISIEYASALHKCFCGCGKEVVTPISPTGWKLIFDGKTVSLTPSIGNWALPCKSHYWITNDKVEWSYGWDKEKIDELRKQEQMERNIYYSQTEDNEKTELVMPNPGIWAKIKSWFS